MVIPIPIKNIKNLKLRKKGRVAEFAFLGLTTGAISCAILRYSTGCADCDNSIYGGYDKGTTASAYAIGFGILGTGIGAIVGTTNKNWKINEDIDMVSKNVETS